MSDPESYKSDVLDFVTQHGPIIDVVGRARVKFRETFAAAANALLDYAIVQQAHMNTYPEYGIGNEQSDDPDFSCKMVVPDLHVLSLLLPIRERAKEAGIRMTVTDAKPSVPARYGEHEVTIAFDF